MNETKVTIEPTNYFGWNGYKLSAGNVSIGIVPDIGGRIISFTYNGEELLFVNEKLKGRLLDLNAVSDLHAEKKKLGFLLWGGDKTWVAPQKDWWENTPPLDLDAGKYKSRIEGNAIVMESPVCRETGLKIIRKIELLSNGDMVLTQELYNMGDKPVSKGIWDVTQFMRPFDIYLPTSAKNVRPYSEEGKSVELYKKFVAEEDGWTKVAVDTPAEFKFGAMYDKGETVILRYSNGKTLVHKRTFEVDKKATYAHASTVEIYNSSAYNYFELEIHSPQAVIAPGSKITHRQTWKTFALPGKININEVE